MAPKYILYYKLVILSNCCSRYVFRLRDDKKKKKVVTGGRHEVRRKYTFYLGKLKLKKKIHKVYQRKRKNNMYTDEKHENTSSYILHRGLIIILLSDDDFGISGLIKNCF